MTSRDAPQLRSSDASIAPPMCAHCGLPVPAGLIDHGQAEQFCCIGCQTVHATIRSCGLDSYYDLRRVTESDPTPARVSRDTFEAFDTAAFERLHVRIDPVSGLASADLMLEGVHCGACVWLIERLPRVACGVVEARLSLRQRVVRVTWDPSLVKLSHIARLISRLGYTPHPARGTTRQVIHHREKRRRLIHLGAAGAIAGNVMLLAIALYAGLTGGIENEYRVMFRWLSMALGVVALVWPGSTFFISAWSALRARSINLDVPIALALLAGGVAGSVNTILDRGEIYFDSLCVLIFLLLVGRWLQYAQQRRADDAVELLFNLTPATCRVVRLGRVDTVPVEALVAGDIVEVRDGELIPADAVVTGGDSSINQALLTGESAPVSVTRGDTVHAGAQNTGSTIRISVTAVGAATRVGRLMELIQRGVEEKSPIVAFVDKVGVVFTIAVTIAAAGVFAYWAQFSLSAAIDHSVALLIVTCPCVLGLATPLTLAVAIGRLARQDVLVKSAVAIERLSRAKNGRLILDKTGTLTTGQVTVIRWEGEEEIQPIVAEIERHSPHPIARALCEAFGACEIDAHHRAEIRDTVVSTGDGISARVGGSTIAIGSPGHMRRNGVVVPPMLSRRRCEFEQAGQTAVLVARDGRAIAVAALGDSVRPAAKTTLQEISRLGWKPSILSGDAQDVVASVAAEVGIIDATGEATPEHKLQAVKETTGRERTIVMVGDGVNDAAALAAADVGIAVHGGAEASLAAADVYIARPGLGGVLDLLRYSSRAMRIVRRNLVVSAGYNLLAGLLAAVGVMHPLIAAILMPLSSATVLLLALSQLGDPTRARGES